MTKYVVELTPMHVFSMSPERVSQLGTICKWAASIATLDMGGLAIHYIVDMLVENAAQAAKENLDVRLDNANKGKVGEGEADKEKEKVDSHEDHADKLINGKCKNMTDEQTKVLTIKSIRRLESRRHTDGKVKAYKDV